MALAWVLGLGISCMASCSAGAAGVQQQAQTSPSPAAASPQATAPPAATRAPKLRHHKKAKKPTDCDAATASTPGSPATSASGVNCPPAKIVVNNGSTAEPSIQLTGTDAPRQNDTTAQSLAATEKNLKKISALNLTASQQEMVSQIHQFMDQSKAAVAAGDAGRAHTLALKAQTLAEELTQPVK
jgi:hypothetical protein